MPKYFGNSARHRKSWGLQWWDGKGTHSVMHELDSTYSTLSKHFKEAWTRSDQAWNWHSNNHSCNNGSKGILRMVLAWRWPNPDRRAPAFSGISGPFQAARRLRLARTRRTRIWEQTWDLEKPIHVRGRDFVRCGRSISERSLRKKSNRIGIGQIVSST